MTQPAIRVVLVLYRMKPSQSPAYLALQQFLATNREAAQAMHLTVCDNTPGEVQPPDLPDIDYRHDPSNPGLARSYNLALQHALQAADRWLLLLDQDTTPTPAYFSEVLRRTAEFESDTSVVVLAPKLVERGKVQSPHRELVDLHPEPLPRGFSGFCQDPLNMFNSGAVVRLSQLQRIGGFPEEFWLDFLDHATFHLLTRDGGKVYVMETELFHELSANAEVKGWDRAYLTRHGNVLDAEFRYYRLYGSRQQKRWYRLRLLRHAYGSLKHMRIPMLWQLVCALVRIR